MKWLRVMNDLINLSQVVRFELLPNTVIVFYAVPELIRGDDDQIVGSRLSHEEYTGPAAAQLRKWITHNWPVAEVEMTEL